MEDDPDVLEAPLHDEPDTAKELRARLLGIEQDGG